MKKITAHMFIRSAHICAMFPDCSMCSCT